MLGLGSINRAQFGCGGILGLTPSHQHYHWRMVREQDFQSEPVENKQGACEHKVSESVVEADQTGQLNDTTPNKSEAREDTGLQETTPTALSLIHISEPTRPY